MMYKLSSGSAFLRLSEDLEKLEYGKSDQIYSDNAPFQFSICGIPITPKNILHKKVSVAKNAISIDFSDLVFSARFPGNNYCRPDPRYTPEFALNVSLRLDREDLVIDISSIKNIGSSPLHVIIAQGLMKASTQSKAEMYLPIDYGMRFDFPRNDIFSQHYRPSSSWSLPVHGIFTPNGGIGLWCEDLSRDYTVTYNTDREGTVNIKCTHIFDSFENEPRQMRFMLFDANTDFRDLSRRCRELRIASGRFQTLVEKAKKRPVVAELPGTVFWKHNVYFKERPLGVDKTYSLYVARPNWNETEGLPNNWTAAEIFETAKERGFDRVTVCNTGWNKEGFDAGYPDRFPVNPERGTEKEFSEAAKHAHTLSQGYFLNVHDNYIDAYESSASFDEDEMVQLHAGAPEKGAIWRGGQSYILCSANSLKYAQRDIPIIADISGPGCIYIDVFAGVPLETCRSKLHPLTKRENLENNRKICSLAQNHIGALAVEGCGTDIYADLIDIGAYGRLHFAGFPVRADGPIPVPVPMWQMVYHDCVLNYFGEGYTSVHGREYQLYQALYTLLPTSFDEHSKRISLGLRSAYTAQMIDFEELVPRKVNIEDDGSLSTSGVARSVYSDGTEVVANFSNQPYTHKGKTVPARDYIIESV
jgi:hypothetical protein